MQFFGYILVYGLLRFLHMLPRPVLGLCADFFYFLSYRIVGYRKQVVMQNLALAFPDYTAKERKQIARRYYHHLADMMLESAIAHFDSEKQHLKRMTFRNPELIRELYRKGRQVVAVTAHYGNWEFLPAIGHYTGYRIMGAYKPLRNKYFDRMVFKSRQRYNTLPVPMEKIARAMIEHKRDGIPAFSIFVADQRPPFKRIQYWTKFLGQDTPFYLGAEKMARKLDAAVVFASIHPTSRFHYEIEFSLICEDPSAMAEHAITDAHVAILESMIREEPAYWLWSHKRWKHSYERYLRIQGEKNSEAAGKA